MTTPPQQPPPPPAGGAAPPPGYANNEEKTWALVSHFGGAAGMFVLGAVGGWIAPLVAYLSKGNQSPTVRAHSVPALNFQITWSIVGAVGWLTFCIGVGVVIYLAALVVGVVFGIIAGVKAVNGEQYTYPLAFKFVK
jgi:uncharacterized protein